MILVVNKQTSVIEDIDQRYDGRFYDHIEVAGNPVKLKDLGRVIYESGIIKPIINPVHIKIDACKTLSELKTVLKEIL